MTAVYRFQQGVRALLAFSQPVDFALAERWLPPTHLPLFHALARSEQLHSLNVLRTVLAQAEATPPELAAAALLHDCGKARYRMNIAQRTLSVLVARLLPRLNTRLSGSDPQQPSPWWRAPFVVRQHHPAWSAAALRAVGAAEITIWLAAHHADSLAAWADHPYAPLLARLQQADDAN